MITIKNVPGWCSGRSGMKNLWKKVGFTLRAIRHVHPYLHFLSSGVISRVLSLETAS